MDLLLENFVDRNVHSIFNFHASKPGVSKLKMEKEKMKKSKESKEKIKLKGGEEEDVEKIQIVLMHALVDSK